MPALRNGNTEGEGRSIQYCFETIEGTEIYTLENYTKALPDRGRGIKAVYPGLRLQTYMTYLTPTQAEEVQMQPFVNWVFVVTTISSEG
jgi:hypothetical protein